jgi:hypothetical protein
LVAHRLQSCANTPVLLLLPAAFDKLSDQLVFCLCCLYRFCSAAAAATPLLQLLNKLSDQLAGRPLPTSPGSVHCLLLQLVPMTNTAGPVSMGRLQLRWKRPQPAAVAAPSSSSSKSAAAAAAGPAAAAAELAVGAAPPDEVTTSLELPRVVVQDSLVSVKVVSPHRATAGIAFPFTVQVGALAYAALCNMYDSPVRYAQYADAGHDV